MTEPTFKQIENYCQRRRLVIITKELFYYLQSGRSAEPIKHGQWVNDKGLYKCTACNELCTTAGWARCIPEERMYKGFKYCPNCGAIMDRDKKGQNDTNGDR